MIPQFKAFEKCNFIKISKTKSIIETLKIAIYELDKLKFKNNKILDQDIIFEGLIGRIRDIEVNSKGEIFLIKRAFLNVWKRIRHRRIQYPTNKNNTFS